MTEYDPDDPLWVPVDLAAHHADVQVGTIRQWKARNLVRVNAKGLYSLRDVQNWLDQRATNKVRQHADAG